MLDVKEVARLLAVSEKTIYRWISKSEIPAYKIGETYRFNKVDLLEWATSKKIKLSYEIFDEKPGSDDTMPSLFESLMAGGIHYRLHGTNREEVLQSVVDTMNLPDDVDKNFLLGGLMSRENLGTTAIGDGIAIPHVRNPIVFHVSKPVLSLCFLEQPIDFGALDAKPVDTLFTIISPTVRSHLHILSRLSFILYNQDTRREINAGAPRQTILDIFKNADATLAQQAR